MELPKRKNIRLKDYDYCQNGAYFITICTHNRECLFGEVCDGIMHLSRYGKIAYNEIANTSNKRLKDDICIDKFIVMPNHVHMIVNVGSRLAVTETTNTFSKPKKIHCLLLLVDINLLLHEIFVKYQNLTWQAMSLQYGNHVITNTLSEMKNHITKSTNISIPIR